MSEELICFIQRQYPSRNPIPLHEPTFAGNEKAYVLATIDSTFVSTVGEYVPRFEAALAKHLGVEPERVLAVVNGTNAIHLALVAAGVLPGDLVITQPLTFVATCNAIAYQGADPLFLDVDENTLGLSPDHLKQFLQHETKLDSGNLIHRGTGRRIAACLPMYTFGHGGRVGELRSICLEFKIPLVEDAAEALGSSFEGKSLGTFGDFGVFSFNGNKIVTTGGGGAIVCKTAETASKVRHLGTTAKVAHRWSFYHDQVGYNYRMPNLNAALGLGQVEQLSGFLKSKRKLAHAYFAFLESIGNGSSFVREPQGAQSNYWLNAIKLPSRSDREAFLQFSFDRGVMCRPPWQLMNHLPMYANAPRGELKTSEDLCDRLVNLPSTPTDVVG